MTLSELIRTYDGYLDLESFIIEFVQWLKDKDISLAEPVYYTEEFDIEAWARRVSGKPLSSMDASCPQCDTKEFRFMADDYICAYCRLFMSVMKQDTLGAYGYDDEGNALSLDDDGNISVRYPDPHAMEALDYPIQTLAYQFLRYQIDRAEPRTKKMEDGEKIEIPF